MAVQGGEVALKVFPNFTQFHEKLNEGITDEKSKSKNKVEVPIDGDLKKFEERMKEVEKIRKREARNPIEIAIELKTADAIRELKEFRRVAESMSDIDSEVHVDTKELTKAGEEFINLQTIMNEDLYTEVHVDRRQLGRLKHEIDELRRDSRTKPIHQRIIYTKSVMDSPSFDAAVRGTMMAGTITALGVSALGATPAVVAFGQALGAVFSTSLVLPSVVGAAGASVAAFALSLDGLGDAMGSLAEKGKEGRISLEEFDEATNDLAASAKEFNRTLFMAEDGVMTLYEGFQKMKLVTQESMFRQINQGLEVMDRRLRAVSENGVKGMGVLTDHMAGLSSDIGSIVENWARFRFSDQGWADLNTQLRNARGFMTQIVDAMDRWNVAWNNLSTVGSAYLPGMGRSIRGMADSFARWTTETRQSGDMVRLIDNGIKSAKNIGEATTGVFRIMGDVLFAAGVNARDMSDRLREGTESIEKFTSSTSGQASMAKFFGEAQVAGAEMGKTLLELGRIVAVHLTPIMSEFIQGFAPKLRESFTGSVDLFDSLERSAFKLGEAFGDFAIGMENFGEMMAPVVDAVLPALVSGFKQLAPTLGTLAGPTATLMLLSKAVQGLVPWVNNFGVLIGGSGLGKKIAITGVALATFTGTLDKLLGIFFDLNDSLGGIPAKLLGMAIIVKKVNDSFVGWGAAALGASKNTQESMKQMTAGNLIVSRAKSTWDRAKVGVAGYASSLRGASAAQKQMNASMINMGAASAINPMARMNTFMVGSSSKMQALSTSMENGLRKITSAAGKATRGLMNVVGGPWVLGVGAALAVFSMVGDANESLNRRIEALGNYSETTKNKVGGMMKELQDGASVSDVVSKRFEELQASMGEMAEAAPNFANRAGAAWSETWQTLVGKESQAWQHFRKWEDQNRAFKEAERAIKALGMSSQEFEAKARRGGKEWGKLMNSLGQGEGAELARDNLNLVKQEINELDEASEALGPSGMKVASLFDEISESGGLAEGSLNKAREAMMLLNGTQLAMADSTATLTKQLDMTEGQLADFEGASLNASGGLDVTTSSGAALHEGLLTLGDTIGTAVESGVSVDAAFGQASDTLLSMRDSAGLNEEQWQALLEQYELTPERIETLMVLKTSDALMELEGFRQSVANALDQNKNRTSITLETDEARNMAEQLFGELNHIAGDVYEVELDANSAPMAAALQNATEELRLFDTMKAKPFVYLDTDQVPAKVAIALQDMGVISEATPEAIANIDITKLDSQQRIALGLLFDLNNMTVDPEVSAYIDPLLRNMGYSQDAIDDLKQSRVPDIKANGKPAKDEMGKIEYYWDGMQFKAKWVPVEGSGARGEMNNVREYWNNMTLQAKDLAVKGHVSVIYDGQAMSANRAEALQRRGKPSNFIGPVNAKGGRFPGYARGDRHRGYQLPTSGPGTEETDGFLAYDRYGMPNARLDAGEWIINGAMSEKYDRELMLINQGRFPKLPGFAGGGSIGGLLGAGKDILSGLLGSAGAAAGAAGAGAPQVNAEGLFEPIATAWDQTQATLAEAWSSFTGLTSTTWTGIQQGIELPWSTANSNVLSSWTNTSSMLNTAWTNFRAQTSAIWTGAQSTITSQWGIAGSNVMNTVNSVMQPAFANAQNALAATRGAFQNAVAQINPVWSNMGSHIQNVVTGTVQPNFQAVQRGLTGLEGWFGTTVGNINTAWRRIEPGTGKPGRFVVETVFNNGILKAWNAIATMIDQKEMSPVGLGNLGGYATGGVLPGYTPGKDVHRFRSNTGGTIDLSGGEAIMRPEWTRAVGGPRAVEAMNSAARTGGVRGVGRVLGEGAQFASGGVYFGRFAKGGVMDEKIAKTMRDVRKEHGKPYQWGGVGNPSWDCSGLWSGVVHSLNGGNMRAGRLFNTNSLIANPGAFGFKPGLSGRVTVGVSGDHMAGTIDGVNIESASMPKGVQVGGSAWGSDNGYFPHQYTLAKFLGKFLSGGMGGGGGPTMAETIKSMWDDELKGMASYNGNGGLFDKAVPDLKKVMVDKVWKFVEKKAEEVIDVRGPGGSGVDRWRPMVKRAFGFQNEPLTTDHFERLMQQMDNESGGDEKAVQNGYVDINTGGNEAAGLFQFAKSTWPSYWDPRTPNDRLNGWSNINAAIRYARGRHNWGPIVGSPGGWKTGGVLPTDLMNLPGFGQYFDQGGLARGTGNMQKDVIAPERVLSPNQTRAFNDFVYKFLPTLINDFRRRPFSIKEGVDRIVKEFRGIPSQQAKYRQRNIDAMTSSLTEKFKAQAAGESPKTRLDNRYDADWLNRNGGKLQYNISQAIQKGSLAASDPWGYLAAEEAAKERMEAEKDAARTKAQEEARTASQEAQNKKAEARQAERDKAREAAGDNKDALAALDKKFEAEDKVESDKQAKLDEIQQAKDQAENDRIQKLKDSGEYYYGHKVFANDGTNPNEYKRSESEQAAWSAGIQVSNSLGIDGGEKLSQRVGMLQSLGSAVQTAVPAWIAAANGNTTGLSHNIAVGTASALDDARTGAKDLAPSLFATAFEMGASTASLNSAPLVGTINTGLSEAQVYDILERHEQKAARKRGGTPRRI